MVALGEEDDAVPIVVGPVEDAGGRRLPVRHALQPPAAGRRSRPDIEHDPTLRELLDRSSRGALRAPSAGPPPPVRAAFPSSPAAGLEDESGADDDTELMTVSRAFASGVDGTDEVDAAGAEARPRVRIAAKSLMPAPSASGGDAVVSIAVVAPADNGRASTFEADPYHGDESVTSRGPALTPASSMRAPNDSTESLVVRFGDEAAISKVEGARGGPTSSLSPGVATPTVPRQPSAPSLRETPVSRGAHPSPFVPLDGRTVPMRGAPLRPLAGPSPAEPAVRRSWPGPVEATAPAGETPAPAHVMPAPRSSSPPLEGDERPPRYGLLVGAAVVVSILAPVGLFLVLNRPAVGAPRIAAQEVPDLVRRDDAVRLKARSPAKEAPSALARPRPR